MFGSTKAKVKMLFFIFRLNNSNFHSGGDPAMAHDQAHHSHPAPVSTESSRLSSDEGENEEREEATEKLDCHYSGYHPRPAAVSTRNLVILKC